MDPFEEFEFKPLTDGLGFHKKAEKLKQDIQLTNLSEEKIGRTVPEPPPKSMFSQSEGKSDLELDLTAPRPASKSISDLIAALPPSLDFLENGLATENTAASTTADSGSTYPFLKPRKPKNETKSEARIEVAATKPAASESRPQIFQPLGRADYKAPTEKAASSEKAASPMISTTSQASLKAPTPGTPATWSGTNAPLSARANLPPAPTLRSPLKPGVRAEEPVVSRTTPTETVEKKALAAASREMKKASASFAAAILDLMAITGVATIFLVVILMITRIDLVAMLSHAKTDLATMFHLVLLFGAVMHLYMLSTRCFFGASIGEWSFDLQMGTDEEQKRASYPFKVIWRMALVLATGVVLLPLLSKLFGRDLFALLGGPQLYRRQV